MDNDRIDKMALASGFERKLLANGKTGFRPYNIYKFAGMIASAVSHKYEAQRKMDQDNLAALRSKVYELTYDYGDGYFTVFMTSDKQMALDFIESVRAKDQDFNERYGRYDDLDEGISDTYNENHPLKPYAKDVFNATYENSFSEWALEYAGDTHATSMGVMEHELKENKND